MAQGIVFTSHDKHAFEGVSATRVWHVLRGAPPVETSPGRAG